MEYNPRKAQSSIWLKINSYKYWLLNMKIGLLKVECATYLPQGFEWQLSMGEILDGWMKQCAFLSVCVCLPTYVYHIFHIHSLIMGIQVDSVSWLLLPVPEYVYVCVCMGICVYWWVCTYVFVCMVCV